MVYCDKDGTTCYWFSAKKKWKPCSVCNWECTDKVHPGKTLCAACFEEENDRLHQENSKVYYPACMAPECRAKTITQRAERDKAMNIHYNAPVVKQVILPPQPPFFRSFGGASSCRAELESRPPPPPFEPGAETTSADVRGHEDKVKNLQDEVKTVSQKIDLMMDILETLRLKVCLSQPLPVTFQ
jgi:hypothetical protein